MKYLKVIVPEINNYKSKKSQKVTLHDLDPEVPSENPTVSLIELFLLLQNLFLVLAITIIYENMSKN